VSLTQIDSTCPRCGQAFHCGVNDAAPCACGGIELTGDTLRLLRERYTACLCLACLHEISSMPPGEQQAEMKKPAQS
jgi:hypothetical protein